MKFKEIKVARVDKEDVDLSKQLDREQEEIDFKLRALTAKINLFWGHIRIKYSLPYGGRHFIRNKTLYRQELS